MFAAWTARKDSQDSHGRSVIHHRHHHHKHRRRQHDRVACWCCCCHDHFACWCCRCRCRCCPLRPRTDSRWCNAYAAPPQREGKVRRSRFSTYVGNGWKRGAVTSTKANVPFALISVVQESKCGAVVRRIGPGSWCLGGGRDDRRRSRSRKRWRRRRWTTRTR